MSNLRPHQALLHPAWLGALAVLVLNDHVLKGADLLPGLVTGKLSDFAGLLVAPVLLAVLLRVRTEGGLLLATLVTGGVFSALQLSAGFAAGWDGMMAAVGVPWRTFSDRTDLVALPMLAVGWFALLPSMLPKRDGRGVRAARALLGGTALMACVATSQGPMDVRSSAEAYVLNDTEEELEVYLRRLKPGVLTTCEVLGEDPGSLPRELFDLGEGWALQPHWTLPLEIDPILEEGCRVVLVEIAGLSSVVLYWEEGDLEYRRIQPTYFKQDRAPEGGIAVQSDDDGGLTYFEKAFDFLHVSRPVEPGVDGVCEATEEEDRLFFDLGDMTDRTLLAVEPGLDGCLGLELASSDDSSHHRFLCVPEAMFPFVEGDTLSIDLSGEDTWSQRLDLSTEDGRRLLVVIGGERPVLDGLTLEGEADDCVATSQDSCGTLGRTGGVWAGWDGGEARFLSPGAEPAVGDMTPTETVTAYLGTFEDRVAVDPDCTVGVPLVGADLELAIRIDPIAQ